MILDFSFYALVEMTIWKHSARSEQKSEVYNIKVPKAYDSYGVASVLVGRFYRDWTSLRS